MNNFFLSYLSKAVNTCLRLDSESKRRLKKLQGNVINVELFPFHFMFQCEFTQQGVDIKTGHAPQAATKIKGTPLQMVSVMIARNDRQRFFAEDLIMEGDAELGQQVVELFDELQIDWEDHLSRITGDVPAHHIGRFIQGVGNWLGKAEQSFTQNVNEFVHEEKNWLPTREALQDFFHDVDVLRMDIDRMEARLMHLSGANKNEDTL